MTRRYAEDTKVSVEKSRMELERILTRYGACSFAYATEGQKAMIQFRFENRQIRFYLTLPDPNTREFTHSSRGARTKEVAYAAWEQACRQKWRALNLVIKAKLEAVEAGITTLEDEFLANTMLPDGSLFGAYSKERMDKVYLTGSMPKGLFLGFNGDTNAD